MIYRRYFLLVGPAIEAELNSIREERREWHDGITALAAEYGFKDAIRTEDSWTGTLKVIGFHGPLGEVAKGWKLSKRKTGDGYEFYVPDQRLKAGKDFDKQLSAHPKINPHRRMRELAGVCARQDVIGAGRIHFVVTQAVPDRPDALSVSIPFDDVNAELPEKLREGFYTETGSYVDVKELTEYEYTKLYAKGDSDEENADGA